MAVPSLVAYGYCECGCGEETSRARQPVKALGLQKGDPYRFVAGHHHRGRFWLKVDRTGGVDACWPWLGAMHSAGYGDTRYGGKRQGAHRVVYELLVGEIPPGMTIDHLCRNRRCVNPAHLEVVTQRENTLRGMNPCAINARKTHCPQGHPHTGERNKQGQRICRECLKARWRKIDAKRKEARRLRRG